MLLKRALLPAVAATVVSLESDDAPAADAGELNPMEADTMIDEGPHEAEDAEAAIHKLHSAATSLEELEELVGSSLKTGGLNSQGAHAVGIALEHILDSLGLPQPDLKVALEDFDQDSSDGPTTLVLESVSETLEKVWKAVLEFVDRMIQWFKDFVGDNLGFMSMLTKRAGKIQTALAHVKEFKTIEVHDKALCARLFSHDVAEKDIVPAYNDMLATVANSYSAGETGGVPVGISSAMSRIKSGMLHYGQAKKDILAAAESYAKDVFGNDTTKRKGVPTNPGGTTVYSTPTVLGGVGWYYFKPNAESDLNFMKISSYRGEDGSYDQLRSLSEVEIKHVLASFKTMDGIHKEFKKELDKLNTYRRNLDGYVRGTSQGLTGGYSEYDPRPGMVSSTVRAMFKLMIGITGSSYAHVIRVTRDMFRLCEISLAAGEQHPLSSGRDVVPA